MERINQWLTTHFENVIFNYKVHTDIEKERIHYSLLLLLAESEKIFLLTLSFFLLGRLEAFLVFFLVLMLTRPFIGGYHASTFAGCLILSFLFALSAVLLGEFILFGHFGTVLAWMFCMIAIALFTPLPSKQRPNYSVGKRRTFRLKALSHSTILFAISFLTEPYRNLIVWSILLQVIQVLLLRGGALFSTKSTLYFSSLERRDLHEKNSMDAGSQ